LVSSTWFDFHDAAQEQRALLASPPSDYNGKLQIFYNAVLNDL
jgi:hypothetical protein